MLPCDIEKFATDFSAGVRSTVWSVSSFCGRSCCSRALRRDRRHISAINIMTTRKTTPPTTPPTIAPMLVFAGAEGALVEVVAGGVVGTVLVKGIDLVAALDTAA